MRPGKKETMKKQLYPTLLAAIGCTAIVSGIPTWNTVSLSSAKPTERMAKDRMYPHQHEALRKSIEGGLCAIFEEYAHKADVYLKRFPESPMKGDMLATAAREVYRQYGKWIPVELALSQAQLESACGTRGKSPAFNPYNVGEGDSGTRLHFTSTEAGIRAYYELMAKDYLREKGVNLLLKNFVNNRNKRYATCTDYELKLRRQMRFIKSYLHNINAV